MELGDILSTKHKWSQLNTELLSLAIYINDESGDFSKQGALEQLVKIIDCMDEYEISMKTDFDSMVVKFEWVKVKGDLLSLALDIKDGDSDAPKEDSFEKLAKIITYIDHMKCSLIY